MTLIDLAFDENFDAHLGDDGDYATVTGRAAFEQGLRFIVTRYFYEIIGEYGRTNIREKIHLRATRVVQDSDFVDDVTDISVEFSETEVGAVNVTLHYVMNDRFDFTTN